MNQVESQLFDSTSRRPVRRRPNPNRRPHSFQPSNSLESLADLQTSDEDSDTGGHISSRDAAFYRNFARNYRRNFPVLADPSTRLTEYERRTPGMAAWRALNDPNFLISEEEMRQLGEAATANDEEDESSDATSIGDDQIQRVINATYDDAHEDHIAAGFLAALRAAGGDSIIGDDEEEDDEDEDEEEDEDDNWLIDVLRQHDQDGNRRTPPFIIDPDNDNDAEDNAEAGDDDAEVRAINSQQQQQ